MTEHKKCSSCRFSHVQINPSGGKINFNERQCRRHPPSVTSVLIPTTTGAAINQIAAWPTVTVDMDCGEWAAREYLADNGNVTELTPPSS